MPGLLGCILFCGMCAFVLSDDDAQEYIYDWESIENEANSSDVLIDFSGLQISTLVEGSMTYHYITGPITFRATIDDSYFVQYEIQKWGGMSYSDYYKQEPVSVCYFFREKYKDFLLPIAGSHNDFPHQDNVCPFEKGTLHIFPVNNSQELKAPSFIESGKYYFVIKFVKPGTDVGLFGGYFNALSA